MNTTLKEKHINRFQWQVLTNMANAGFIVFNDFYQEVKRFVDQKELERLMEELKDRKWVETDGHQFKLTNTGTSAFKEIEVIQANNRKRIMHQIDEQDYQVTIKVLSQMVSNLADQI